MTEPSKPTLSALLDEALSLPASQRLPWVDRLGPECEAHRARLRAMLTRANESERLLGTLPKLDTTGADDFAQFASSAHAAGARIGSYTLLRMLGAGAMGVVWLARDVRDDQTNAPEVAIKLAHVASKRADLHARLAREKELLAKLDHPNIARFLNGGLTKQGQPYLVLERVRGERLDEYCRGHAPTLPQRLALFLQVALAVAHAHDRAILHRDLKPANVMVSDAGVVCLLDFGVGKLLTGDIPEELQLSAVAGRPHTPAYASPEQLFGHDVGPASDVYSLGVILYELLTGARPYQRHEGSGFTLCRAILEELPVAPSRHAGSLLNALPPLQRAELDGLAIEALRKRANERVRSARELANAIHDLLHA